MNNTMQFKFLPLARKVLTVLFAGALACGVFAAAGAKAAETTGEKYRLDFEGVEYNLANGISYDAEFSIVDSGSFFLNDRPSVKDMTLTFRTLETAFSSKDASTCVTRALSKDKNDFIYGDGKNGTLYKVGDVGYNVMTEGEISTFTYDVATHTPASESFQVAPENMVWNFPTNETMDEKGAAYFGFAFNGGISWSAKLTDFRFYDADGIDLGLFIPEKGREKFELTRYGTAGEKITVKPQETSDRKFLGWEAVDAAGEKAEVEFTDNGDGTWSFIMPAEAVTVRAITKNLAYAIDYTGFAAKMDNVYYNVEFSYSDSGYMYNERPATGNILLSWETVSESHRFDHMVGLARAASFSDPVFAYPGNYWFIFGNHVAGSGNKSFYQPGAKTEIVYDSAKHGFNVKIAGTDVTGQMSGFAGNAVSTADLDAAGAGFIAWDARNNGYQNAKVEKLRVTDADGFDLGVAFSKNNLISESTEKFAVAGQKVTLKLLTDPATFKGISVCDEEGKALDVATEKNDDGTYSFVMPECAVRVRAVNYVDGVPFYGTYYHAASGSRVVFGENSAIFENGEETAVTFKAADDGSVEIVRGGEDSSEGKFDGVNLVYGGKTYLKLRKYYVTFDLQGGTGSAEDVFLNEGAYFVEKPEDPTKNGYVFQGWFDSDGNAFDFDAVVDRSVTLYARWEPVGGFVVPEKKGCGAVRFGGIAVAVAALALTAGSVLAWRRK